MDIGKLRRNYESGRLRKIDLDPDPLVQFGFWLEEALGSGQLEPTAMTLATADGEGRPSARMVLLKGHGPEGFTFFSNYGSRKAQEAAANPFGALVFWWDRLERQVRAEGRLVRLGRDESLEYFRSRPRGSQLSTWASPQSRPLATREELLRSFEAAELRFRGGEVPMPESWGGYRLEPVAVELWQGRADRLHDRFRYTLEGTTWQLVRLAP